jgi:putative transposase
MQGVPSTRSGGATASVPRRTIRGKPSTGGLEASDIKRLKELEHENGRLKRMYADLSLENAALKEVLATKL